MSIVNDTWTARVWVAFGETQEIGNAQQPSVFHSSVATSLQPAVSPRLMNTALSSSQLGKS